MKHSRVSILVGAAIVATLATTTWLSRPVGAQSGGHLQVTRLELEYTPGGDSVRARFHLASGLAITEAVPSKVAGDRLFQAALALASDNARMFVTAENNRVVAWQLSVP